MVIELNSWKKKKGMVFYMTIINSFLQKKKLREFSHGFYMVIAAYVLSFLLLVIGSDTLYNIRSKAGRVNAQSDEENRVFEIPDDNEGQAAVHGSADYMSSRSRVESRIDKRSKYQLINQQSQPVAASDDTNWLLGFAMNDEEYSRFMYLMGKNEVFAETDDKSISSFSSSLTSDKISLTNEEIKMLEQIVEAEATGEDMIGKILVANVILNRMASEEFPDNVKDVIFQKVGGKYQFSPIADKRYWKVEVTKETKEAVQRAINGEDYSKGALYFMARRLAKKSSIKWFDNNLEWLFKHGEHEFFR